MTGRLTDARLRRRGDRRARAELAARYLPLARALALRYRHTQEPLDDLVQVASVGLVKAVDRWDPDRGTAFATYAVPTILGELRRYFRDCTWSVKPPRRAQETALRVMRARGRLFDELGREPTLAELAGALEHSQEEIVDGLAAAEGHHALSLDVPIGESPDAGTHLEQLGDDDPEFAAADARVVLDDLVRSIDRRAQEVLRMRFELDLRQWEIAERIGVSQMHVSRILRDTLEALHRRTATA